MWAPGVVTSVNQLCRGYAVELCRSTMRLWGDIQDSYVDVGKPKVLLGYAPGVRLGDGLEELLYYLK